MKTKRLIATPSTFTLFIVLEFIVIGGLVWFIVDMLTKPIDDLALIVVLSILLFCVSISLLFIGYIVGFFDIVAINSDNVTIRRFAKKLRCYNVSEKTQVTTQKGYKGSLYIEIQFPEYIEKNVQVKKGIRIREGYVCLDYTKSRLNYVQTIIQEFKANK